MVLAPPATHHAARRQQPATVPYKGWSAVVPTPGVTYTCNTHSGDYASLATLPTPFATAPEPLPACALPAGVPRPAVGSDVYAHVSIRVHYLPVLLPAYCPFTFPPVPGWFVPKDTAHAPSAVLVDITGFTTTATLHFFSYQVRTDVPSSFHCWTGC